jgi:3-phenylpropionate/trans-cinnamate dioxygenase ferredoxin component
VGGLSQAMALRWIEVARTFEVMDGESRKVVCDGHEIAVFNVGGRFRAVSDRCPHRGASLSEEGFVEDGGRVVCAWHDWAFDAGSGALVRGEGPGCLAVYPVRVEGDRVRVGIPGEGP